MSSDANQNHLLDSAAAVWLSSFSSHGSDHWERIDGQWHWENGGVRARGTGSEWIAFSCSNWNRGAARIAKNFLIEVEVSGQAGAAGISFGAFKDFLVDITPQDGPRRLQLEVDIEGRRWAFRVDGELMQRCWWDAAVKSVEDILNGELRLKARYASEVLFRDLTMKPLDAPCRLSVVVTCHRFLQRLRLSLRNWCHQTLSSGAYEVLVVNPQSPDGTHEHLAAVARSYPHVRLHEITVERDLAMNKGAMINQAVNASRGDWIWLTDADCLFGPDAAQRVLEQVWHEQRHLFFGERRFLTAAQTDALLSGRIDPLTGFNDLAKAATARDPEKYQWGYTQIVHRSTLERLPYDERHNHFAHSDGAFAEACRRHGVLPQPVEGLFCLHLDHPFSWYGSEMFL